MYCDICLKHLKIFTHERKCYTREALVRHRKEGDADDRSHRGHPLCQFCDERYLDNDELLQHLRKNHFWCHICEKDGNQDYYPNYHNLRRHFKQAHFLCEEGECFHEKFTSVFRMKVDYQAHTAQQHSDRLSKAEARQMRQLDINITFAPREDSDSSVSARDYSFPEQGHERYRERSRMTSGGTGRDFQFGELRDPGRYKAKDKDRKKENQIQPSQDPKIRVSSEQYRQTDVKAEDHKGVKRSQMRSPREVLESDHKRPPGDNKRPPGDNKRPPGGIIQEKVGNRKIHNSNGSKSSNTEQKNGKSGKGEADNVKSKKDSSKKKELSGESLVSGKEKKPADEGGFDGKEKNNGNLSKTKVQGSNEGSSDQKAGSKSKTKNNKLTQEKNVDPSLAQSGVRQENNTGPSSSSVIHPPSNLEDDFPALLTDKKQGPAVNIAKPKPTYDSDFPSLSNESSKANSSIRSPPGLSAPPGFSSKLDKPKPDHKRLPGDNKRPPGDNKRPPGGIIQEEVGNRKTHNSNGSKSSNTEQKNGKSGKGEADNVKSKKDSNKKKELSDESIVSGKEKKPSLDEGGFGGKEKNNGNLSKIKIQESNEGSSDQKADSKSKTRNNKLTQEKNVDLSLEQSGVRQEKNTGPSFSSVVHPASNLEDDFPTLSTDKKQGPAVNIAKPKPTYDSDFPSLSNESSKANPCIRPPPGLSAPPGFSGKLVKPKPDKRDQTEVDFESGQKFVQFSDLYKSNTKSIHAQKETLSPEKALANKSKSSVPKKPTPKPTYDSEFPTLSTLTNGHKASSAIKAPPGLVPPGFQPGIPVRPPPGMGWSVPINVGGSSAKETRNQKLINDIGRILNLRGESFEKFREVSSFYRHGKSSPEEYYQECCSLLGVDHIHKVFRELIDLLPDEGKQRQLLLVYNDAKVKSKLEDSVTGKEESGFKFNTVTGNNDISASNPALSKAAGKKKSKSAERISSA
ncbi:Zinc finger 598 [Paramuricea clavata]|uniref:Zinc finger 598 n=1 Tax=Paramuricea clavata TaxID=317549 RepID=A0A6S7JDD5_PARCT|nr:Zinc finger 598 [Paramuricea clavata]